MKTILAISLLTATFALIPSADAECVGPACLESYGSGTCDNGYGVNYAQATNYDANGYIGVAVSTYCGGEPGYSSYQGVGAGATYCDPSWNCDYGGVYWSGGSYGTSSYCDSSYYTYVGGQSTYEDTRLCQAGAPPAIPALLP